MEGNLIVEKFIKYAKYHLHLDELDVCYKRNELISSLKLNNIYKGEYDFSYIKDLEVPDDIIKELKEYILDNNLVDENYLEAFITDILGELTPLPSTINRNFIDIKNNFDSEKACKYLYDISIKNWYIKKTAIEKNLHWIYKPINSNKFLEITVNLSKPEKNNKDTAKLLLKQTSDKYPSCLLCKENEGFEGSLSQPPRRNLRTIKLNLNNEKWFLQFSPYAYYNEHCIIINEDHHPMKIDNTTPIKLIDFVDYLPNYFIGSNAPLPIVGGSILNHEHFQGGEHLMPMHKAQIKEEIKTKYKDLKFGILDWYNSALQIEGSNKEEIIKLVNNIIDTWNNYSNTSCDIIANENGVQHNTVSPICRKNGDKYYFTIILRNNNTSEKYPDGIFHVHPEFQNIKHESIGLIEAMGLFILPGRLKKQFDMIEDILCNITPYNEKDLNDPNNTLYVHKDMIKELISSGLCNSKEEAANKLINHVNHVCEKILENTAVFKEDLNGRNGFKDFINKLDI